MRPLPLSSVLSTHTLTVLVTSMIAPVASTVRLAHGTHGSKSALPDCQTPMLVLDQKERGKQMAYNGYRVIRLDDRSRYGGVPVTRWITHGEAMTYARYANRTRKDRYALQSKRMVIHPMSDPSDKVFA